MSAAGSVVQEVTLAVANLDRSSASGTGRNSARNSRNSLGTLATKSSTLSRGGKPSVFSATPNPVQGILSPHILRKSRASAEEFMMYNGLQPVSSLREDEPRSGNEESQEGQLPVRASAVELRDQSNAFGASSAQVHLFPHRKGIILSSFGYSSNTLKRTLCVISDFFFVICAATARRSENGQ